MQLKSVKLRNFRAYIDDFSIRIDDLTALIGRNDVGKSTVFEALSVFFGVDKIDRSDRCVHVEPTAPVEITCAFEGLPKTLVLDQSAETTLQAEFLLNECGQLEILKRFSGENLKEEVFALALHPKDKPLNALLQEKNAALKSLAKKLRADAAADLRSNVSLRKAIRETSPEPELILSDVPLAKGDGAKEIWTAIQPFLPVFALFKADRPSTDTDGEVQDPMKVAVREALQSVSAQLAEVQRQIEHHALGVAQRTLTKLEELDSNLASTLKPQFRAEPKWDTLFKLSLNGDHDIPVNKRGSGVRRLILLCFFQAELERRRQAESIDDVIYAIEEPETSQHPTNQVSVVEALKELAQTPGCQVMLTTHVPALTGLLPIHSIRHVTQDSSLKRSIESGESGESVLKLIAEDLGVLPDLQDGRVRVFLCVEGPTDVEFLRNLSRIVRNHDPSLLDLSETPQIAAIPLGGATLKDWVNRCYLKQLGLPEFHLYDRDNSEYAAIAEQVCQRGDGSFGVLTTKREIENYLHSEAIRQKLDLDIEVADDCDVEREIISALGQKRIHGKSLKRYLAEEVSSCMTVEYLKQRGALTEVCSWFQKLGEYIQ